FNSSDISGENILVLSISHCLETKPYNEAG
ncbi:uncharacterized protein METZ01_LOCUS458045, partial [marine metagenome]